MVVGWPGSEAADRASGPHHAFEARANRTLPHRCNLLLAYHCLLACFACLLLQGAIMADQWEVAEEMLDFAALQSNPIDEEGSELERLLEEEYNGYDGDLGYEEPTMLVAALASARLDGVQPAATAMDEDTTAPAGADAEADHDEAQPAARVAGRERSGLRLGRRGRQFGLAGATFEALTPKVRVTSRRQNSLG